MFDCHVHSNFSGDSSMDPYAACDTAIKSGLLGIAFTDHLDIDYPDYADEFLIDFDKYSKFMDKLKFDYEGKLKVYKGIEVGMQPHVIDESIKIIKKYDFDQVILSTHVVDRIDLCTSGFYCEKTKEQAYDRYLSAVYQSIKICDDFDVLGHVDLIRRYGNYKNTELDYLNFSDRLDMILKELVKKQKALEINTSGFRYNLNSAHPNIDIVKRFKELGGEFVCMSSDAHMEGHIGYKFDYVKTMLIDAGFKYSTHFESRKPIMIKI